MLENLFISKVRVKLLKLYTLKPSTQNHVRGLVRDLDEEINAVRRELKNLEETGILKSKRDGNKIVFSIDGTCPILPELRALFRKAEPNVLKIHKMLMKHENVKLAILTGNFFTKKYVTEKDIDLLIVGTPDVSKLNKSIETLEHELARTIKVALFKPEEFEFRKKSREDIVYNAIRTDKLLLLGEESELLC